MKNKKTEAKKENKIKFYIQLTISILLLLIIFTGLVYGVYWLYEKKVYKDKLDFCLSVQNSKDLKYNCTCIPDMTKPNKTDEIDSRTEKMCRCSCDIGKDTPYVIEIRRDKTKTSKQ